MGNDTVGFKRVSRQSDWALFGSAKPFTCGSADNPASGVPEGVVLDMDIAAPSESSNLASDASVSPRKFISVPEGGTLQLAVMVVAKGTGDLDITDAAARFLIASVEPQRKGSPENAANPGYPAYFRRHRMTLQAASAGQIVGDGTAWSDTDFPATFERDFKGEPNNAGTYAGGLVKTTDYTRACWAKSLTIVHDGTQTPGAEKGGIDNEATTATRQGIVSVQFDTEGAVFIEAYGWCLDSADAAGAVGAQLYYRVI